MVQRHVCSSSILERITRGALAEKFVRRKRLFVWVTSRSAIISHQDSGETSNVKPHSLGCPRRASNRSPHPCSGWPEADMGCGWPWATSGKQTCRNGFNHSRKDQQGNRQVRQTSPQLTWTYHQHRLRIFQQNLLRKIRRKAQFVHSFSQRPELRSMQTHECCESATQKKSWRSGGRNWNYRMIWRYDNSRFQSSQWRARVETASQICSVGVRPAESVESKISLQNQISSGDGRGLRKFWDPEENPRSTHTDNSLEFMKACVERKWNHERPTPRRSAGKHMELQNELYDDWKKALHQCWFSLDSKKAGGQKQWSVIAIFEMCKT